MPIIDKFAPKQLIKEGAKKVVSKASDLLKQRRLNKLEASNKDVFDILTKVDEIVKSGKANKNPYELLQKAQEAIVADKKIPVGPNQTKTEIGVKDFKVKVPQATEESIADFLKSFGETTVPKKTLMDFNINKINANDDIYKLIDSISSANKADILKQTRGVRTHSATKAAGTRLMKDENFLAEVLSTKAGTAYNSDQAYGIRQLLLAGDNRLKYLAEKITDKNADNISQLDILRFRQHYAVMSQIQKVLLGVKTEAGRVLNQFKISSGVDPRYSFISGNIDSLNRKNLIVELGGEDEIKNVASMYLKVSDTNQRLRAVRETGSLNFATKTSNAISEVFLNAILSNPWTHIRNNGGNWVAQWIVDKERYLASRFFSRGDRGEGLNYIAKNEDIAKVWGKHMAATEIIAAMKNTFKLNGSKIDTRVGQVTAQNMNITNKELGALFDLFGKGITLNNIPTKLLKLSDDFFKNREFRSEIYARAFSEGMEMYEKKLLPKEKIADFIASRVANPTDDMLAAAKKQAEYVTFQTELGTRGDAFDMAKGAQTIKNYANNRGPFSWLTNYYFPFIKTPTNITGFIAERTPILAQVLTRYNSKIAAGGREAAIARAQLWLGSMFYMATAPLGYYGITKGSDIRGVGSRVSGSKYQLQQTTKEIPFDIQIPIGDGKYASINTRGFDPMSQMLANSANLGQYISLLEGVYDNQVADSENQNYSQAAQDVLAYSVALSFSIGENLANSTVLTGAGKLVDDVRRISQGSASGGVEGFKKAITQVGGRMASSYVPSVIKEASKLWNSEQNKLAVEFTDYFKKGIYDKGLEFDYDHRGRRYNKPSYLNYKEKDAIDLELASVFPNLSPIERSIQYRYSPTLNQSIGVPLNAEELRFLKKNTGLNFDKNLKTLFDSNIYKNDTRHIVREGLIQNAWKSAKEEAKGALLTDQNWDQGDGTTVNYYQNIKQRAEQLRDQDIAASQRGYRPNDNFNNNN